MTEFCFAFLGLLGRCRFLHSACLVFRCDLPRNDPAEEGHATAEKGEREKRQARNQRKHDDQSGSDHQGAGIASELPDNSLVGGTGGSAARHEQARSERNDQRRDLGDQTVTDGKLDEDVGSLADRHVMAQITDDDPAEDVDGGDDQAGDRIAADELRGTVHGTEERALLLQLATAMLRFLLVDQAGRKVGVDRHLLAGDGIEGEARADFGDTRRTLGDDDEVHRDQNEEDDQTDDEIAGHDETGEAGDDAAGSAVAFMTMGKDDARRCDVQRQANHGRNQKNRRKG